MHCFSHVLHLSIILSSIASCFITFMHLYGFLVPPWSSLIIFMSFGWSFLASCTLCQSWQKEGEIVENMWFLFFKILHVRGRNTFLCKGEMCFILLAGVLTSLFLYTGLMTIYRHTLYLFSLLYCWCMFLFHLPFHVLFLFFLYTHASYFFMQYIIFVSHIDALMSFV